MPVVPFGETPLVVVTTVGRYNTLAELIAAAKAKPGELNYSTVGIGSAVHFGAVRLTVSAGITAQHIPFKGPEWLADTIAGRVDFSVPPVTTVIGPIRDGKLKALAVGAAKRSASLPDVPTLIEAGLKADAIYPFFTGRLRRRCGTREPKKTSSYPKYALGRALAGAPLGAPQTKWKIFPIAWGTARPAMRDLAE